MKIAVIGAGPAGLTAAYQLSRQLGKEISVLDIYEASGSVGGMSRSLELWGQTVDLGPHRFFSKDKKINALWLEVVEEDYRIVNRKTRIFYKKRFFDYPIKAANALKGLGIFEAAACVASYFYQRIFPVKDTSTFEGWVTSRFGQRLYRIFFKTYSEKLWGISCRELDSDFASQRIKKFSLLEALKNAISVEKKNKHATLAEQFAYPTGGTGSVYRKMAAFITEKGGRIHLETPVQRVLTEDGRAVGIALENGSTEMYDQVISTMPVTHLVARLEHLPSALMKDAESLKFRNTILVYLEINQPDLFPDQWLYIHDTEVQTGRITNFRNWVPELYGKSAKSILCMEYWCNFEDEIWSASNEKLSEIASNEIVKIGLAKRKDINQTHIHRIPRCYPVYFSGYQEKLENLRKHLEKIDRLHVIGRYGAYKYNNQDHSILMGMLTAENILENKNHNLWEINTDYETYQESSVITKTGLSDIDDN